MTADELRAILNNKFGLDEWPKTYEVDVETYGNLCQDLFNWKARESGYDGGEIIISIGPNNGIMFKNVEILIKKPPVIEDVKCPECYKKMVSRKGQYGTFWGCTDYPNCRGTRDSMGRSKAEREEEKNKSPEPKKWDVR